MATATVPDALTLQADVTRALELLEKLQNSGEVSAPKLATLAEVLRSDFLGAVRGVYEHVYDTVVLPGAPENRASAAAKATVAAFAASEGQPHPRLIRLRRAAGGLGFNVAGGSGGGRGVFVSRVLPGGAAERQGGLRRGDQLLSVDGVWLEDAEYGRVVDVLREAGQEVTMLVRHAPGRLAALETELETARGSAARSSAASAGQTR